MKIPKLNTLEWYSKTVKEGTRNYEQVMKRYYTLLTHPGSTPAMLEGFERSLKQFHDFQMQTQQNQTRFLESLTYDAFEFADHQRQELVRVGKDYWRRFWGVERWLGESLFFGLFRHFAGDVLYEDQQEFSLLRGNPVLYLANHQVAIESLLFSIVVSVLTESPVHAIAKIEHQTSWLGQFLHKLYSYPGLNDPDFIFFFDQEDQASMLQLLGEVKDVILNQQHSLLVHIQGMRTYSCRQPVSTLSSVFLDLAIRLELPIIPVAFAGGLPVEPLENPLEFPYGYTCQNYHLGQAIFPDTLNALPHAERKSFVIDRINQLSHVFDSATPHAPDRHFERRVRETMTQYRISETHAVFYCVLEDEKDNNDAIKTLLDGIRKQEIQAPATPEGEWLAQFGQWLCERQLPIDLV